MAEQWRGAGPEGRGYQVVNRVCAGYEWMSHPREVLSERGRMAHGRAAQGGEQVSGAGGMVGRVEGRARGSRAGTMVRDGGGVSRDWFK